MIFNTFSDLRYAWRSWRKTPGLLIVAILSLAAGIGANAAMFTLANGLLFKPLAVSRPDQLEVFDGAYSAVMYRELRDTNTVFDGLIARQTSGVILTAPAVATTQSGRVGDIRPERVTAELVSGNYFSVLGISPALGRFITADEERRSDAGAPVVVSYRYWQHSLQFDQNVVGRTLLVDHLPMVIVGVAPQSFSGIEVGTMPAVWVPLGLQALVFADGPQLDNTGYRWLHLMGRRKPSVTEAAAETTINGTFQQLIRDGHHKPYRVDPQRIRIGLQTGGFSRVRLDVERPVRFLLAIVGLVLLIASANLVGLLLVRVRTRRREIAVRIALGAGAGRLRRLFVTEALLLAIVAAGVGVAISTAVVP